MKYRPERRAFILPMVLVLVTVLATLGSWYLFSTVQSKNVFHVFYRDDIARLIAESAVAEFRATIFDRIKSTPTLSALLQNPSGTPKGVPFTLSDLSATKNMAQSMVGADQTELSGTVQVRNVDDALIEVINGDKKRGSFDREYQGTLRFQFNLGLGSKDKRRFSSFLYEFDIKRACLRSRPAERVNRGYTTNALNDYVLYIRDVYNEFKDINVHGTSLNDDERTLIIDHSNSGQRGRIFLGCGREGDADLKEKFVFVNVNSDMNWLLPEAPPDIVVPWSDLKKPGLMPKFTADLETAIQAALQGGGMTIDVRNVRAVISVEYKPLVGRRGQSWWQTITTRIRALFDRFFNAKTGTAVGNKQQPVNLVGPQNNDQSMCELIDGNVRQRFWQTATFKMDFSQVNPTLSQAIGTRFDIDVQYFSESELEGLQTNPTVTDATKETYKLIKYCQDKDKSLLMSMPNDQFPFKPQQKFDTNRNSSGTFPTPPLVGRSLSPGNKTDYTNFQPFSPFLMRSYRFSSTRDLYNSPFYDAEKNVLHLNGIFVIENPTEGLTIKAGTKYSGRGVLLSYGNIRIEGDFKKLNDAEDGPCILYTYRGNIIANEKGPGSIEASLIALNYQFPTGKISYVNFSGRPANVKGNLLADRLQLGTMSKDSENRLTYDSGTLTGDMLYTTSFGGRLRSARMVLDDPAARN